MRNPITNALLYLCFFTSLSVSAHDEKESRTIERTIALDNQAELSIHFPVGEIELVTADVDEIFVAISIEQKDSGWFSGVNLEKVELEQSTTSSRVKLSIKEDDIKQTWQVTMPEGMHLNVDVGVGEIKLTGLSKDIYVDMGVGAVDIQLASANYYKIDMQSGVGDANIRDFKGVEDKRAIVSKSARWQGNGEYRVSVDVGVGDASISR